MRKLTVLEISVFLLCGSCKDNPVGPLGPDEIWPMKTGNFWIYFSEYLDLGVEDTMKIEVTGSLNVTTNTRDVHAWRISEHPEGSTPPEYEWLRSSTSNGVYLIGGIADSDTLLAESIEYKYPAAVGDSWDALTIAYSLDSLRFYVRDTLTYTLVSADEELQTPAGTFRCYLYQFSKRPADDVAAVWDYRYYFVPGKGLVGYLAVSQSDRSIKEKSLLWKYRIQ